MITGQIIKIKFKEGRAFITENKRLNLEQLGLHLTNRSFDIPAVWTVQVMKHFQDEKRLSVNIRSYNLGNTEFPTHPKQLAPLLDDIEQMSFTNIDTKALLAVLKHLTSNFIIPNTCSDKRLLLMRCCK